MKPTRYTAQIEMMEELKRLQAALSAQWLDQSLPEDWDGLDASHPVARPKTRVTVRLDADMVRWFRRLGPGYGARLNTVLRIYWTALLSGRVKAHWDEVATAPRFATHIARQIEMMKAEEEGEE